MIGRAVVCVVLGLGLGLAGMAAPRRAAAQPPGDAVALLPLDADKSLEIYGQPVASEIARALAAGNVRVVVVGPRMAVPDSARMIIDGTIAQGKASGVTISLRIRNRRTGVPLRKTALIATAPSLAKIDSAAVDLSAQLLPLVRELLAALPPEPDDHGRVVELPPVPAPDRPVLVAVDAAGTPDLGPLRGALATAAADWTRAHHRVPRDADPARLAPAALSPAGADLAIGFSILGWTVESPADPHQPAMARARVRVQIVSPRAVVFDRVVATDTVLGDPGHGQPELAARVAREVLAILGPHMRRSVPSWR
ncbi:MAG TPA: hypothetical protein VHW23_20530 [Kofleriaceae bacterium]|jgi:hypothetical protein|nr:hypothetical protein [Kofleriaceae bacterium]